MSSFREAIENRDIEGAVALLASDVVFRSPVVYRPYQGREVVAVILRAVAEVFEDFHYTREIGGESRDHALVFRARVGGREVEGCDFLHLNEAGQISEFVVMTRPLSGALALADAMKRKLEGAQA